MPNILYIHGANSTKLTWSFITPSLPKHNAHHFEYNTGEGVRTAIKGAVAFLDKQDEPWTVVAHSLGGIVGMFSALETKKVERMVSISTPYGGSNVASVAKFFNPGNQLLDDICPYSPWVAKLSRRSFKPPIPVLAVATYRTGPSMISESNDGVVTLASQKALSGAEYVELELNHFEVLMSKETVGLIQSYVWN